MISGWAIVSGLLATLGAPLVAVGIIIFLCERSWDKRLGEMGSVWLLGIGLSLCLPLLIYLAAVAWDVVGRQV